MGVHVGADDVEWRNPEDALVYDSLLLRSVFSRLRRQSADEGIVELDLFSKQQVIDELEIHQGRKLLRRRPNLRKLHTRLSSLTNIQESISLDTFRITRVRDKTISFDMANALLHELCRSQLEAEHERRRLVALAYKPMWCVRDAKLADNHLATTYNVGFKPPHTLTSRERLHLERRAKWTRERAAVVAQLFVHSLMQSLFPPRPARRPLSRPSKTTADPSDDELVRQKTSPAAAKRKKTKPAVALVAHDHQHLASLKLRVLCPGYDPENENHWRHVMGGGALDTASDAEAFVAAVESAGEPSIAHKLWSQAPFRSAVSFCCENVPPSNTAPTNSVDTAPLSSLLLDTYGKWLATYRAKSIARLR